MTQKIEEQNINSPFFQLIKNEPQYFAILQTNRPYEAKVIKKTPSQIFFDLGRFGTGIVYGSEFQNAKDIIKNLKIGETTLVKSLGAETDEGYLELSLTEANKMKVWQEIKDLQESGESIEAEVQNASGNGLIVALKDKIRAFLPTSQLSNKHLQLIGEDLNQENWEGIKEKLRGLVGQKLNVKIVNLNQQSRKIVVSEKETMGENAKELISEYKIGQTISVIVSNLTDFGVFVNFNDNPKVEGLIYNSELSYRHIEHPKEVVKINDALSAKIIDIRNNRIFLSLKALKPNPWEKIEEQYKVGQKTKGKVYKVGSFGAVVDLENVQGLVPITQFESLEEIKKQLPLESEHQFVIEEIKPAEQRIILKLAK